MKKRILLLATLTVVTFNVAADDRKIWACSSFGEGAKPIIYLVEWGSKSYIKFSNVRIATAYREEGSAREWVWDSRGGYYNYSLSLGADNQAVYHDFTSVSGGEVATATDKFSCKQIQ